MKRRASGGVLALLAACAGPPPPGGAGALSGTWRAVLASPGGDLPFTLRIGAEGAQPPGVAVNGLEEVAFTSVGRRGDAVTLRIDGYDSQIVAVLSAGGRLEGEWTRTSAAGASRLPFAAVRGDARRFGPVDGAEPAGAAPTVSGAWTVTFTDADGRMPARGEFVQEGERVLGTFLTPLGDYRYLEGEYRHGRLRLSCFDGAHAFLFDARALPDGTLAGDFWSRDSYHARWTARPAGAADVLPDPFALVGLSNDEGRLRFRFPDLGGQPVSLSDPRFAGKAVVINLFGSWCPNCNDEAPLLAGWYRRYRDRGLEIVGLAYEMTGQPERDAEFVRKYAERHGVDYPLLLAGTADKAEASRTLPDLDRIAAFPTTVFIGRDGRVRQVHSGFAGPGTGEHHQRLVRQFEDRIEALLAETTLTAGAP